MAINPVLAEDGTNKEMFPLPMANEVFFLKRDHVGFKLQGPRSKLKGSGKFFLSSRRIVFLKKGDVSKHSEFSSFEIPLHLVCQPKFQQPIFGANYMEGKVDPLRQSETPIEGTSKWSITFNAGGAGTFLNVFYKLWKSACAQQLPNTDLINQLHMGNGAAFVDPSDPSLVYVTQPVPAGPPQQQPGSYGNLGQGQQIGGGTQVPQPGGVSTSASAVHPPGQYGAPASGQYVGPPPGQYGAPPPGQYGAPPAGQYGAPPPGPYGAPPPGPYGAPPPGPYGAPPPGPYGAPPPGPYGAPPAGQYGVPPPGQYGAPPPGQYGAPPPGQYGAPAPQAGASPPSLL